MSFSTDKFVITIECRANNWDDVNDFISELQNTQDYGNLIENYRIFTGNIYIDKEDY